MITVILLIFSTFLIVNLYGIIAEINTTRAIIFIIDIIITIMAITHKKKIVIFVAKNDVVLTSI